MGAKADSRTGGRADSAAGGHLSAVLLLLLLPACGTNTSDERVTVPAGTSFAAVTDSLVAHGVVSNRVWFKLLARVRRADRSVRAGVYEFEPGVSAWKVLNILA